MRLSIYRYGLLLSVWLIQINAFALVPCIRVTSEHNADTTDLSRFREFHAWNDKTGNELAIAVWRYVCDYETGLYHFNEILEDHDPFVEYATVRDPLKILNVYNMGYCGIFGPVLDGIFQGIGFDQGRSFGLVDWNHCATEVWYDGAWRYFDLDVRGVVLNRDGKPASLLDAQTQRTLWIDPPVPIEPFFPNDPDKDKIFGIYEGSPVYYYYRWFENSHTMDFYLRQGESLTRWWTPQGGRWNHRPLYNRIDWIHALILTPPIGMKPNHRHFTRWNHGNGLFHYQPNLTSRSGDYEDGVLLSSNLIPAEEGLRLIETGEAEAIFDVCTPYLIVAKINDPLDFSDDSEASLVALHTAQPVRLSVSLDHGLSWCPVTTVQPEKPETIDLTKFVKGTYGYWLKLSCDGEAGALAVRTLSIDTWTQVAPISLPRLRKGLNHLRYDLGDRYGQLTIPMLITPNAGDPDHLSRYLAAPIDRYRPDQPTERIQGDAMLRFAPPPGRKIAWCTLGATFRTHQGDSAAHTDNRIAYAIDRPERFQEIYRSNVPTWVNHWRYNWDTDVKLDQPAQTVYARYTGNPAVNTFRATLHYIPKRPVQTAVQITHGYRIDDTLRHFQIEIEQPSDYTVHCEDTPENVFIKIAAPSSARKE